MIKYGICNCYMIKLITQYDSFHNIVTTNIFGAAFKSKPKITFSKVELNLKNLLAFLIFPKHSTDL